MATDPKLSNSGANVTTVPPNWSPQRIWELIKRENIKYAELPKYFQELWKRNPQHSRDLTLIVQDARKPIFERMLNLARKHGNCQDMCLTTPYFACDPQAVAVVAMYLFENKNVISFDGYQPTLLEWASILLWTTRTDQKVSFAACAKAVVIVARQSIKEGVSLDITPDMLKYTPERANKFAAAADYFMERSGAPRHVCM